MGARYRWGTALVVAVALAAGGGGALYLLREWEKDSGEANDDPLGADASADARVARGKGKAGKAGKKGARGGKPRGGGGRIGTRGSGGNAGGGNAGGGIGGAGSGGDNGGDNGGAVDNGADDDDNEEKRPPPFRGRGPAGPTYEAAIASNTQEITIGKQGAPDLTDAQLSGPMRNGAFVDECGAADGTRVTVQVAVKMGRAAGVSVSTSPPDPDVAGCIDRYVRTFSWPSSPKMDSFKTTY